MRIIIYVIVMFSIACNSGKSISSTEDKRPNIVIIMADDLGYSDPGCYGSEINTPNLDRLAAEGIRFSSFYNTSRCCPSRASLLTGVYSHQADIGEMTTDKFITGYRGALSRNTVTIAEVLKDAGYHTAMSGKWHVSNTIEQKDSKEQLRWLNHQVSYPLFSPLEQYPTNRGFEKYFGNIWGVVDFFDPFSLVSGTTPIDKLPSNYYHTDAINDTAVKYVNELSKEDKPFFLYVAETAPHWPLQALPEDIRKYQDTYKAGWDVIRKKRYEKMIAAGLIDSATTKLSSRINNDLSWEKNPDKEWDARAMAVHAAMIDRMDQGIGRIIEALKSTGEYDNTIIVFLSDNGASPEIAAQFGPGFDRPSQTRDGRVIVYPKDKKDMPGPQTVYGSIGPRWANVSNTPYQYAKADSYEGGIRTPCIVQWPAAAQIKKGSISDRVGHIMDLMATAIDVAHTNYPSQYHGESIKALQGTSFKKVLQGKEDAGHDILFNEHYGTKYVRTREWKLVARKDAIWHLYKIRDDETEINDLAATHPKIVSELINKWNQWAAANQVIKPEGSK